MRGWIKGFCHGITTIPHRLVCTKEVSHSSESDICAECNGSLRNDGSVDDNESSPSSHFTTTDQVSKASTADEVSDEGKRESGRIDNISPILGN